MTETVTIPRAECERLYGAALAVEVWIAAGKEEFVPVSVADRLVDGAPPLRESGASIAVSHNPPLPGPPG